MSTQNVFGAMTLNFAAAIGVKQALKTVNYEMETLTMECDLQKKMAVEMGGIGGQVNADGSTTGLIGEELETQIASAENAGASIRNEAFGTLAAGIATTIGCGATVGVMAKLSAAKEFEDNVTSLKSFKSNLETPPEPDNFSINDDSDATSSVASDDDDAVEERIEQWKGNGIKEGDLSARDDAISNKAIAKLKDSARKEDLDTVKRSVDREILRAEERALCDKSQRINTATNIINQASNAVQSYGQSGGKIAQANTTTSSQEETAFAGVYDKTLQTLNQIYSQTGQAANNRQSEIATTLQNIAFPA